MKTLQQIQEENREFIIMANNPTAKTYDEALEMELGCGCIIFDLQDMISKQTECNYYKIIWLSDELCILTSLDNDDRFNDLFINNSSPCFPLYKLLAKNLFKIIGKPLTLNRVLISICEIYSKIEHSDIIDNIYIYDIYGQEKIKWDLTKETLEDQSEKTQRKINKLLIKSL